MKTIFCLLAMSILSACAYGQGVSIDADHQKTLCQCTDNVLTVAAKEYKPGTIILATNNGTIWGTAGERAKGIYHVKPAKTGRARIYAYQKLPQGKKLIDSAFFEVKVPPLPEARFNGKTGGDIQAAFFRTGSGPTDAFAGAGAAQGLPIQSFTVTVFREYTKIFKKTLSAPAKFDKATKDFLNELMNGDKVVFNEIAVRICEGAPKYLAPIEFTVIDVP